MKVLLISGKQGSGKSTTAQAVCESLKYQGRRVGIFKFADPIYEMHDQVLKVLTKYQEPHTGLDGRLLQLLGTEWGRAKNPDMWVNLLRSRLKALVGAYELVIVDDLRFPNELKLCDGLRNIDRVFKVRLFAEESIRRERALKWRPTDHESEVALDGHDAAFDARFNSGEIPTHELVLFIRRLLRYSF